MALAKGIYLSKITCPICNRESEIAKVKSSSVKLLKRDPDFCGYYATINPTFYGVQQCEHCGYTAFESDFEHVTLAEKQGIQQTISQKWQPRKVPNERGPIEAIALHQMCLVAYKAMHRKDSDIAKICLRLAWFYRLLDNPEKEKHFVEFALQYYLNAFNHEALEEDPENQMLVYYLLGDLYRQKDDFKNALYWYQECLKLPHIKTRKPIETLARDQIAEVREKASKK